RDLAQWLSVYAEDLYLRRYIVEVPDEQLASGKRITLNGIGARRHYLSPFVPGGVLEIGHHYSPFGRLPIRLDDKSVSGKVSVEMSFDVVDDSLQRAAVYLLHNHFILGPSMLSAQQQVTSVFRAPATDPLVRPIAFAKDFNIICGISAHGMVHDPHAGVPLLKV